MRKRLLVALAFLTIAGFSLPTTSAQLPIKIPKIPKPNQPKPKPSPTESPQPAPADETQPATQPQPDRRSTAPPASSAAAQDQPTIAKDWVQVRANTINSYKGNFDVWSWLPLVAFRTNSRRPSGANYYVEFNQPGGAPWVKLDCESDANGEGYECGGPNDPKENSITAAGVVSFAIKMRNELAGTNATLFTGRAKVEKVPSDNYGPKAAKEFVYFVNHDWALPIAYVFPSRRDNFLAVAFWVRGGKWGNMEPHVFYQGKEVGIVYLDGIQAGRASCEPDRGMELEPTISTAESVPHRGRWARIVCDFTNVLWADEQPKRPPRDQ
jgi:hypothetical protein